MELLLLILLFIILYPILRIAFGVWRQVHHIKKQFSGMREQYENARTQYYGTPDPDNDDDMRSGRSRSNRTRVVQSMGEYVDYEEIVEERKVIAYDPTIPTEPQITDAEYEEIP